MVEQHEHSHHAHNANKKTLMLSLIIIASFMLVEVAGGILTNSLALLADAGHMLSDSLSLFIALMAFTFSGKVADYSKTYGYKRFEILAAVINGATLILISFFIMYKAIDRFQHPVDIASKGMMIIAFIGLFVNVLVAWIMYRQADVKENLNMRAAYLHVMSDMLGSVGAIVAAFFIMFFGWYWADPVASILVAILVLRSGYLVTKSSVHVLMEGTPDNVKVETIIQSILNTEGVKDLHDLHVWTITSGLNALTCHVIVDEEMTVGASEKIIQDIGANLLPLNVHHITIQLESSTHQHDDSVLCKIMPRIR